MDEDLAFVAVEFRAEVHGGAYDVEQCDGEWWAWFFPRGPLHEKSVEILDPRGNNWPTRDAAIEACRRHHALRTGAVSMADAGPVSVDGDGAPV